MELHIYRSEDDYNALLRHGAPVDYYVTTLNGYEYIMNRGNPVRMDRGNPFRFINGLGEKRSINPMDISRVLRTQDGVTVILNIDTIASKDITWNEILNG